MKRYITTPIYYVNDIPHIGHAYTTIIADFLKRFYQLCGDEVLFVTGTDEHGEKIQRSAQAKGKTPQEYTDEVSQAFRSLWDEMGISYDRFIRTTEPIHIQAVKKAFLAMQERGDIYLGEYEGHYCVSCESFFTQTQLRGGDKCPDCGKDTEILKEESYFFVLSKYQDELLRWYRESHPILPAYRENEVIAFVSQGLSDLSITRTTFQWGIPIPKHQGSKQHIIYVWLDALMNYLSVLGYGSDEKNMGFWGGAIHLVGKDILRFHAIYWPAFLLSLGIPLPQKIYAHGWWLNEGQKMSKSIGNVINPRAIHQEYGDDLLRYFLLREVPFGQDGDFVVSSLIDRSNSQLSNDLGNLLNRIIAMSEKYFSLHLNSIDVARIFPEEVKEIDEIFKVAIAEVTEARFHRYLEEVWKLFDLGNAMISKYEPWNLQKQNQTDKTQALLVLLCNLLDKGATLIAPVMPQSAQKIASALGRESIASFKEVQHRYLSCFTLHPIPPLFPRLDKPDRIQSIQPDPAKQKDSVTLISLEDYRTCDIRVGEITSARAVEGSEKLLCLQVDLAEGRERQIISGIAQYYRPEDLVGMQVCILANLKPAKLMGLLSEGMILSAKDANGLSLITPEKRRDNGGKIG